MKILDILKEELDTIDGGKFGHTKETLDKVVGVIDSLGGWVFSNETVYHPSGKYRFVPTLYVKRKGDTELALSVKVYLILNEYVIPTDFLIFVTEWMTGMLKSKIPGLEEMMADERYMTNAITYNFREVFVSSGNMFMSLDDYVDTTYYNTHIMRVYPLEELISNRVSIQTHYELDPSQTPTFSEDFSLAIDRVLKKVKSIYRGFRKGTYRGHQYEYKENNPKISILVEQKDYNPQTKVIQPKFRIQINAGFVSIDGKGTGGFYLTPENKFSDDKFVEEFNHYIKARFEQFGIKII
jgi:hypothetical protein